MFVNESWLGEVLEDLELINEWQVRSGCWNGSKVKPGSPHWYRVRINVRVEGKY